MILIRPIARALFWAAFLVFALCQGVTCILAQAVGFLGRLGGYSPPKEGKP